MRVGFFFLSSWKYNEKGIYVHCYKVKSPGETDDDLHLNCVVKRSFQQSHKSDKPLINIDFVLIS